MSFQDRAQHSIGQIDKEVRTAYLSSRGLFACCILTLDYWLHISNINELTLFTVVQIPSLEQPGEANISA